MNIHMEPHVFAGYVSLYATHKSIGNVLLDNTDTLMSRIEAYLEARRPLTEADVIGMRWTERGTGAALGSIDKVAEAHDKIVDRLWTEVLRLRNELRDTK